MNRIKNQVIQLPPQFQLTENDTIKVNSSQNVLVALQHDNQLKHSLKYNEFTEDWEITRALNLRGTKYDVGEMTSDFESALLIYFEQELQVVFTQNALKSGLDVFFRQNRYNPVQDYMEQAHSNWDGKERIGQLFQTYLGANDNAIVSSIALIWLVGAVKKVFEPYSKFDYVLDLVGGQGIGKTTLLQKLGGEFYTDAITDFKDKDNIEIMLRALIVNDDEMAISDMTTFQSLKAFITKTSFRFRKSYGRRSEGYPKKFVIARTTNEEDYLKDKTGERRFLPVICRKGEEKASIFDDLIEEDIAQIWGEAMSLYRGGFPTVFTREEEEAIDDYRKDFRHIDEVENLLNIYLDMRVPADWETLDPLKRRYYTQNYLNDRPNQAVAVKRMEKVATLDFVSDALGSNDIRGALVNKVGYLMKNKKGWIKKEFRRNRKKYRGFVREK